MPEAVATYFGHVAKDGPSAKAKGLLEARETQASLFQAFLADFAKHSGAVHAGHIASVFLDVPRQLSAYSDASVQLLSLQGHDCGQARLWPDPQKLE
jgi:hypothetical protein